MSAHAHAADKVLVGFYDDDDVLLDAVKELRGNHVEIDNVYTPFPIHGLDYALGLRESRLPTVAFLGGCLGFLLAQSMMIFMYTIDWQVNVGGKPRLPYPAFIPISFEATILICSLSMVFVYLIVNNLLPGKKGTVIHPRQTDDLFLITVKVSENEDDNKEVENLFKKTGAIDTKVHEND